MPHPLFSLLVIVLLAAAMAAVADRPRRERIYVAIRVFVCCAATIAGGIWLMYLIHG